MDTHALTTIDTAGIERLQKRGLMAGVAGLVLGMIGVALRPDQFMPSWLIGFLFCTGLALGCLALLILQHMTGGQWGLVGRRILEADSRLLRVRALFVCPSAAGAPRTSLVASPEGLPVL